MLVSVVSVSPSISPSALSIDSVTTSSPTVKPSLSSILTVWSVVCDSTLEASSVDDSTMPAVVCSWPGAVVSIADCVVETVSVNVSMLSSHSQDDGQQAPSVAGSGLQFS